jgi:hypothetical protein
VGVAPGRFPCTAQVAKHKTQDEHANQDSFSTRHLHDFKWTNPFGEKLARLFAMLQTKVLRTQQHLITDLQGLLNTILVCKRFLSLLSRNQTFACKLRLREDCKRSTKAADAEFTTSTTSPTGVRS